jgi:multisubunit Na+/H+ antiporter MnhG subunit
MRIVLIALITAALTTPAFAQRMGMGQHKQPLVPKEIAEDQKKRKAAQDKAYKNALDQIPDQKPADPWGKMR